MARGSVTACKICVAALACALAAVAVCGCASGGDDAQAPGAQEQERFENVADVPRDDSADQGSAQPSEGDAAQQKQAQTADELRAKLSIVDLSLEQFVHGQKPAECQKYIVLHDTEGDNDAASVVSYWAGNGNLVAARFIVNKDGSVAQCAPLDAIVHHAGYGDTGHNAQFGVEDESRDDKLGTVPIGSAMADYGMNSYSVGIEMVHVGGSGDYPQAQLRALDDLIAYIDAYYGFGSAIIDHKAWRTGNSDTSEEFAGYLRNYQEARTHDGTAR